MHHRARSRCSFRVGLRMTPASMADPAPRRQEPRRQRTWEPTAGPRPAVARGDNRAREINGKAHRKFLRQAVAS
jgi:hypothetical protein